MSRARDLADLGGSANAGTVTGENLIINGDMAVAQRGTSSTGITSGQYHTVDRAFLNVNTAGTWTATQSTTAPADFVNSVKYDCTVADASLGSGDYVIHQYNFEGQDLQHLNYGTANAKKTTVSFYVRSNKTGTYTLEYQMYDGSNYYRNGKTYTIDSADTWEYKTITIDGNTSNSINNANTVGLQLMFWLAAGTDFTSGTFNDGTWITDNTKRVANTVNLADSTSNEWLITGIKLEVGSTATPFQHESYGDNLAKCQRYYHQAGGGSTFLIGGYQGGNADDYGSMYTFPTTMRAAPSSSVSGTWSTSNTSGTQPNVTRLSNVGCCIYATASGAGSWYLDADSTDDLIKFDAEL